MVEASTTTPENERDITPQLLHEAIEEGAQRAMQSPETARAFFRELGVIDEQGQLTPAFGGPATS